MENKSKIKEVFGQLSVFAKYLVVGLLTAYLLLLLADLLFLKIIYERVYQLVYNTGGVSNAYLIKALTMAVTLVAYLVIPTIVWNFMILKKKRFASFLALTYCCGMMGLFILSRPAPNQLFNILTGEPLYRYYRDPDDGHIELFPADTLKHPRLGVPLGKLTPEVALEIEKRAKAEKKAKAEAEAKQREEMIRRQKEEEERRQKAEAEVTEVRRRQQSKISEIEEEVPGRILETIPKIIAQDDFESGTLEGGTGWKEPLWTKEGYAAAKPSGEAKQGNYVCIIWGKEKGSYVMRSVDLSSAIKPRLQFWAKPARLGINVLLRYNADYAIIQVSRDQEKWELVNTWVAKSYEDEIKDYSYNFLDFDLSSYAGVPQLWIKFTVFEKSIKMIGDNPILYVDDIKIVEKK
jgi:hypothetical protein